MDRDEAFYGAMTQRLVESTSEASDCGPCGKHPAIHVFEHPKSSEHCHLPIQVMREVKREYRLDILLNVTNSCECVVCLDCQGNCTSLPSPDQSSQMRVSGQDCDPVAYVAFETSLSGSLGLVPPLRHVQRVARGRRAKDAAAYDATFLH
eukprot:3169866-Amphidinium_carterae.1